MADNSTDKLINVQLQQLAAQVANWAAQLDFAKERFRLLELPEFQFKSQLEIDRLAFEKASETWNQAFKEASLSGTYQGQPTIEWLTQQAQLTGVLNGTQTLQGKLTDAQVAQMNEQMRLANEQFLVQTTGSYGGRPSFEREQWQTGQTGYLDGQSTLARQQMEANLSGYFGGRPTLEREQFGAEQTQNYLNLLSTLQANPFRQLRVLNATPQGLQSLVNAWAGTYNMPGFGSSASPGQTQLSDLWAGANAGATGYPGAPGFSPYPGAPGVPGAPGAPAAQWNPAAAYSPLPTLRSGHAGGADLPPAVAYSFPAYTGPQGQAPPVPGESIPGRGLPPSYWDSATQAAVAAWNSTHPGFIADGSSAGYSVDPSFVSVHTPPPPGMYSMAPTQPTIQPSAPWAPQGATTPWLMQYAPDAGQSGESRLSAPSIQGTTTPGYTYSPPGTQAPPGAYNYSATEQGHTQVYPPGVPAPYDQQQVSTQTPVTNATANTLLATPAPGMGGTLSPSQINAEEYNDTNPYLQNFMWQYFEDQGWAPEAARGEFLASLPKYSGPTQASVKI